MNYSLQYILTAKLYVRVMYPLPVCVCEFMYLEYRTILLSNLWIHLLCSIYVFYTILCISIIEYTYIPIESFTMQIIFYKKPNSKGKRAIFIQRNNFFKASEFSFHIFLEKIIIFFIFFFCFKIVFIWNICIVYLMMICFSYFIDISLSYVNHIKYYEAKNYKFFSLNWKKKRGKELKSNITVRKYYRNKKKKYSQTITFIPLSLSKHQKILPFHFKLKRKRSMKKKEEIKTSLKKHTLRKIT